MVTPAYDIGDQRRLQAAFTDVDGNAADPTTLTFRILEPDGTETSYVFGTDPELVKDGTGNYYVDWTIAKQGRHIVRWVATGTVETAEQTEFYGRRKEGVT